MIAGIAVVIIDFEGSPHVPLIFGTLIVALVAWKLGFEWKDIEGGMYNGIRMVLPAILILIVVGMIIGSWIGGGIITSMTYYGLKLLSPSYFLVAITLICCVVSVAIATSFLANVATADQYLAIVVPSRMYAKAFQDRKLHPKNLSRALEDGGTITSVFVPWSTCGVFIYGTLGVSAFAYAPYAILNYSVPLISIVFSLLGISVVKMTDSEAKRLEKKQVAMSDAV